MSKDAWRIALTDQAKPERIAVMDAAATDWTEPSAMRWSWAPSAQSGFEEPVCGWHCVSDVKLRNHPQAGPCLLIVASGGFAAIITYAEQPQRIWSGCFAGNLHSAELLPDGNIALAASTGGYVRLYASSQGKDEMTYAEYALKGAHGVHWDCEHQCLWAIGDEELIALSVGDAASSPTLREKPDMRWGLPTHGGHDLSPVYGDSDLLWVTTVSSVYQFRKSTRMWETEFARSAHIQKQDAKSIGNFPNGPVVMARPGADSLYVWTTDTVEMVDETGIRKLRLPGAAIYKARVFRAD